MLLMRQLVDMFVIWTPRPTSLMKKQALQYLSVLSILLLSLACGTTASSPSQLTAEAQKTQNSDTAPTATVQLSNVTPTAATTPVATSTPTPPTVEPSNPTPMVATTPVSTPTPISAATAVPTTTDNLDSSYDRRTPFVPLDDPLFLPAEEANYLQDDDLVLVLEWENETRAYPVRMLRFHHIVNDTIAGRPFLITY